MESEAVDVERAWLEAGKARDVDRMRELRAQHPQWLDLNRKGETRGPETSARACSWEGFRLSSIGVSSIHAAAWDGSVEVVRFLLESGQHPDSPDDWGMTPLMVTVMRLFLVTMRSVFRGRVAIQRNLVVDCRDEDAVTIGRTLEIARMLKSYGSDLQARNAASTHLIEGKTALHIAAFDDGFEVAKYLLACGVGVDIQDHNGQTALHHSINAKSLLVTNLLLESGASIDIVDESRASPLSLVVSKELTLQLQLMLNHHQLVATSSRFDFATAVLHEAVDREAVLIAAFLLENRYTSVSSQDADGESALHRALRARSIRMLRELREFDDDDSALASRTRQGESCFHFAARFGGAREVEILLDKYCTQLANRNWADSPLNWANAAGETALMIAGLGPRRCRDDDAEAEDDRSTTVQMLKLHGARLFPAGSLRWKSVRSSSEQVLLPACARRCLCRWLVEHSTPEVCYDWVSSVEWCSNNLLHQERLRRPSVSAELVNTLLDAGYATNAVQLLVLLPMKRSKVESLFLDSLRSFAGRQRHELLLELVESLTAAWRSEAP